MKSETLQVFEFDRLGVDDRFTLSHFEQLVKYNEKHHDRFFTVGHKCIRFRQYVGVIQVGNLTIEILPKAERATANKDKWRNALLTMLTECRYIRVESLSNAFLRLKSASLVDLYFETFLNEVGELVHKGLTKRYRWQHINSPVLRGRLLLNEHLTRNHVHREKFFVSHQVYDKDNLFNQILLRALEILQKITSNPYLAGRTKQLLLSFEDVSDVTITAKSFERIQYNRKTYAYEQAIQLARLIILQYAPDLKGGGEDVLAILFDMNVLFESYVYGLLKKQERHFTDLDLRVHGQHSRPFWMHCRIRPDVVLDFDRKGGRTRYIVDTKWKMMDSVRPSDEDLKQMYVYNLHFDAEKSFLVYPWTGIASTAPQLFHPSDAVRKDHACGLYFLDLFDEAELLNREAGKEFLEAVISADMVV